MYYLTLYTLRLTLTFICLIIPSLLLGRAQPPDSRLTALHLTDCAPPCWIGILPDQTTWRDAKVLFRQAYPGHVPFDIAPNDLGGALRLLTYHDVDEGLDTVPQIFLADWSATQIRGDSALMPRLSDLLLLWGVPTCVIAPTDFQWAFQYNLGADGRDTIEIYMEGTRLSPHQPIFNLRFYRLAPVFDPSCDLQPSLPWYGFASFRSP